MLLRLFVCALYLIAIPMARCDAPNGDTVTFTVDVRLKTQAHPLYGQGYTYGFSIDGVEGKSINLTRAVSYQFVFSAGPVVGLSTMFRFAIFDTDQSVVAGPIRLGETLTYQPTQLGTLSYGDPGHSQMGGTIAVVSAGEVSCGGLSFGIGQRVRAVSGERNGLVGTIACVADDVFLLVCWDGFMGGHNGNEIYCSATCSFSSGWFVGCGDVVPAETAVYLVKNNGDRARCRNSLTSTTSGWLTAVDSLVACETQCTNQPRCVAISWSPTASTPNCLPVYDTFTGFEANSQWFCYTRDYAQPSIDEYFVRNVQFADEDPADNFIGGPVTFNRLAYEAPKVSGYRLYLSTSTTAQSRASAPIAQKFISNLNSSVVTLDVRALTPTYFPAHFRYLQVVAFDNIGTDSAVSGAIRFSDEQALSKTWELILTVLAAVAVGTGWILGFAGFYTQPMAMAIVFQLQELASVAQMRSRNIPEKMRQIGDLLRWTMGDLKILQEVGIIDEHSELAGVPLSSTGVPVLRSMQRVAQFVTRGQRPEDYALEFVALCYTLVAILIVTAVAVAIIAQINRSEIRERFWWDKMENYNNVWLLRLRRAVYRVMMVFMFPMIMAMVVIMRYPDEFSTTEYVLASVNLCIYVVYLWGSHFYALLTYRHLWALLKAHAIYSKIMIEMLLQRAKGGLVPFKNNQATLSSGMSLRDKLNFARLDCGRHNEKLVLQFTQFVRSYLPFFEDFHLLSVSALFLVKRVAIALVLCLVTNSVAQLWVRAGLSLAHLLLLLLFRPHEGRFRSIRGLLDAVWSAAGVYTFVVPLCREYLDTSASLHSTLGDAMVWCWFGVLVFTILCLLFQAGWVGRRSYHQRHNELHKAENNTFLGRSHLFANNHGMALEMTRSRHANAPEDLNLVHHQQAEGTATQFLPEPSPRDAHNTPLFASATANDPLYRQRVLSATSDDTHIFLNPHISTISGTSTVPTVFVPRLDLSTEGVTATYGPNTGATSITPLTLTPQTATTPPKAVAQPTEGTRVSFAHKDVRVASPTLELNHTQAPAKSQSASRQRTHDLFASASDDDTPARASSPFMLT